jgi:hypothetical protein
MISAVTINKIGDTLDQVNGVDAAEKLEFPPVMIEYSQNST